MAAENITNDTAVVDRDKGFIRELGLLIPS